MFLHQLTSPSAQIPFLRQDQESFAILFVRMADVDNLTYGKVRKAAEYKLNLFIGRAWS